MNFHRQEDRRGICGGSLGTRTGHPLVAGGQMSLPSRSDIDHVPLPETDCAQPLMHSRRLRFPLGRPAAWAVSEREAGGSTKSGLEYR